MEKKKKKTRSTKVIMDFGGIKVTDSLLIGRHIVVVFNVIDG